MSSSLTKEQKNDIRKSLPLKIFERRENAADLSGTIEYFNKMLSDLTMIKGHPDNTSIKLAWIDPSGEDMSASCTLPDCMDWFNSFKNDLAAIAKRTVEVCTKKLDEIPNAKIITVDFKNKKIDPDKKPEPLFRPRYDELPEDATAIYQGALNICRALNMGFKSSDIPGLVKEKGLPAFKADGKKHWYALHVDLMLWKQKEQRRVTHA